MFQKIRAGWKDFTAFNKERWSSLFTIDATALKENFNAEFDTAKRLSDFIGMVIRLSFVAFAASYFYTKAQADEGWMKYVFGFCTVSTVGLSFAMARQVILLIFLYEAREVPSVSGKVGKWIVLLFAILSTFIIYIGAFELVQDLAVKTAAP